MTTTNYNLTNCSCCNCCSYAYVSLPSIHVATQFTWDDGTYSPSFTASFSSGKWRGSNACNGQAFDLNFWCDNGQWLFELLSGGIDYSVPFSNGPGGCTLLSCNPFQLFGEIAIGGGVYADDFPFCDKGGTFPDGQRLTHFTFLATE